MYIHECFYFFNLHPGCCYGDSLGLMHFTVPHNQGCMLSPMCCSVQCGNIHWPSGKGECRRSTDIPFTRVCTKQEGGLHSSKQIQETAARFVTLFSHSTRSTSGKWTYKWGKTEHIMSWLVSINQCTMF